MFFVFFLIIRRHPRSTLTYALLPCTTLFRASSTFIDKSIQEVFITIGEAVVLVLIIIFLFLRSFRATIIPVVTIPVRSEEHTSELQSLMRNSYAVFCLKKKTKRDKT